MHVFPSKVDTKFEENKLDNISRIRLDSINVINNFSDYNVLEVNFQKKKKKRESQIAGCRYLNVYLSNKEFWNIWIWKYNLACV